MKDEEKKVYNDRAKYTTDNGRKTKLNALGVPVAEVEKAQKDIQEKEQKMKRSIEQLVREGVDNFGMCINMCLCVFACIFMYMYIYLHIHIYMYIYIYIYI